MYPTKRYFKWQFFSPQGKFKTSDDDAIVTLVKVPFSDETLCNILSSNSKFTETFRNDIYGQFCALAKPEHNPITTQIIHPATEKHKLKYSAQNTYFVYETAEDYKNITLPFLEKQQFKIEVWLGVIHLVRTQNLPKN